MFDAIFNFGNAKQFKYNSIQPYANTPKVF